MDGQAPKGVPSWEYAGVGSSVVDYLDEPLADAGKEHGIQHGSSVHVSHERLPLIAGKDEPKSFWAFLPWVKNKHHAGGKEEHEEEKLG